MEISPKRVKRFMHYIEELYKMDLNLIPIKIERILLNLLLGKVKLLKVGMKDLLAWAKVKKQP